MSRTLKQILVGILLALGTTEAPAQTNCDRGCLRGMLDSYLAAVVAHKPSAAPLVTGFRQTENAINTAPGHGAWQSVTALGAVQRKYFDEVSGQAAYFGTVEEGDKTAIVTIRVRVENRELTEAEWYIARRHPVSTVPGSPAAGLPIAQSRVSRGRIHHRIASCRATHRGSKTLVRIVESYFDALTSHDRTVALAHEGCGRAENGSPAPAGAFFPPAPANAGGPAPAGPPPAAGGGPRDCLAGLENFNLSMVVARRMPLVDVEAQVVLSYAVFIRRPGSPTPRNVFSEWFIIDEAKIRTIYTAMFYPPPTLAVPNWPPYGGNWPLPATTVPEPASNR
jgi:hypothetical protein